MKTQVKLYLFFIIIILSHWSCSKQNNPSTTDPYHTSYFDIECDYITGYEISGIIYHENIKNAFIYAGSNEFDPRRDGGTDLLTGYFENGQKKAFPINDAILRHYAEDHRNWNMNYHILYVDSSANPNYLGISIGANPVNSPPGPISQRYSYIFWDNIKRNFPYGTDARAAIIYTTIHELGHQRIGLTDTDQYPDYHFHTDTFNCVMNPVGKADSTKIFCYGNSDVTYSCSYFLKSAN